MNTNTSNLTPAKITLYDGLLEVQGVRPGLTDKLRYFKKEIRLVHYKREIIKKYEDLYSTAPDSDATIFTLPGFAHRVIEFYRKAGIPFEFLDSRTTMPKPNLEKAFQGLRPYQIGLVGKMLVSGGGILSAATGAGKALANNSKVPTPNGWRNVGDIKEGDLLFGSNGKPVRVLAVYPQPEKKQVYEVEFNDGRVVECCKDHLWKWIPRTRSRFSWSVTTTEELAEVIHKMTERKLAPKVPLCLPVEYPEKRLPVDPYVLGALLGNGCLKENALTISSGNGFVPEKIAGILGGTPRKLASANYSYVFRLPEASVNKNGVERLNFVTREVLTGSCSKLIGSSSGDKFIPDEYLTSSVDQRFRLLNGLLDTDGSTDIKGRVSFFTTSPRLKDGFVELARSLGMMATVSKDIRSSKYKSGEGYHVHVRARPDVKRRVFTLPEKVARVETGLASGNRNEQNEVMRITSIRKTDRFSDMTCFTVESDDHLFLCDDYVVTHNTRMAAAIFKAFDRRELWSRGTPTCVFACPDRDINRKNWEELQLALPDRNVGIIMSGMAHKPSDDIVCCTLDSLDNLDPNMVGIMICDEMHTSSSSTRAERISAFKLARKWGVSATPVGRFDGADIVAEGLYGPIVATFSYQDGVKAGALVPITVYWVDAPIPTCGLDAYAKYTSRDAKLRHGWTANESACQMIADIMNCIPDELQTLCMLQFIDQMARIHQHCTKSSFVHAETNGEKLSRYPTLRAIKPKERKEIYDQFRNQEIKSIISTHVYMQGVNFPRLSVVINAGGGGSDIVAKQVPGRASRTAEGKDHAYIIDFMHPWDRADPVGGTGRPGPILANDFARRKAYKDLGFEQCSVTSISQLPFLDKDLVQTTPTVLQAKQHSLTL